MKDFNQLTEDVKTNEELSKKLAEAGKELRKTGDKAGFIKTAAEFGYEITEKDFPSGDDLVKVSEEELDDVAGGLSIAKQKEGSNRQALGAAERSNVSGESLNIIPDL